MDFDWDLHHRRLERMYLAGPLNRFYRPRIAVERGRARVWIQAREELFHAAHAVHGSVIFKLLDDAAFFAAASLVGEVFVLTASLDAHFLRPVTEGELMGEGKLVQAGRQLLVAESVVSDARGREVARGLGNFARSRLALSSELGYA